MNWLDLAIIFLLLFGISIGIRRGFLRTGLDLAVLVVAAIMGMFLYRPIAALLAGFVEAERATLNVFALAISAVVVFSVLSALLGSALAPLIWSARRNPPVRVADNLLGALPGVVYGLIFGLMLTLFVSFFGLGNGIDRALAESELATRLRGSAQDITGGLARRTGADLADFTYIVVPERGATYRLPPVGDNAVAISTSDEERLVEMLNDERTRRGLNALEFDETLREVARQHSEEMLRLGYFAHESPNTGTLADRLNAHGIRYQRAGENLAYAPSAGVAHRGLMQSEGHRANILEPEFTRIGIGVIRAPDGTLMVTQVFAR
jgi:uncharacterized protein YkwD/uncharacterized membrane protein required for colicin V production